ncbi:molybdopterin oxidoreductase family protein [Minwuia sp.]|uniref:molybdopterin oxidoreductase family protein n=1 Tax=Minwuia sp. TaxID=2493630 RepID=UPI003A91B13A
MADTAPPNKRVARTTCYMCACRCGIDVHLENDVVRYIGGNRDHPVNKGVLCAKGSAGIMQHYSPARLKKPLKRVGERGEGKFEEIEWEEALSTATEWLARTRASDPKKLAFFTGRDQSQSFTSLWAQQYGTPNYAAHGGFCSVNMAAAGIYTMGGAFWEFGSPDWERAKLFLIFGVAEDHDSNPIKMGMAKLKERGARIISVNPIRTGYSAIADQWLGVRPGTDGLLILALIHQILKAGHIDIDYLRRYSNAGWLVIDHPGQADNGLFLRDADGAEMVRDRKTGQAVPARGADADLRGRVDLGDGRSARPVFELIAETYLDQKYAPENAAEETGISADTIRNVAAEIGRVAFEEAIEIKQQWTDVNGETHDSFKGRPVAFHAMRGISAHSNGFQTCRALHLLQLLIGAVDCPGGFRFKPPYPKPLDAHPKPTGVSAGHQVVGTILPNQPLGGPHLGFPRGPEDMLVDDDGKAVRIDKAFSWDAPLSAHGMMHMVIANAYNCDPYPIDILFMYMANMSWNSTMNTAETMEMLSAKDTATGDYVIPKIIYSDAYQSEMTAYADLILPDTTYLERHDCISLLDRPIGEPDTVADAIRWPVVKPDRDVRGFQSVLVDLASRLGLPGFIAENGAPAYRDYADYMINHQRRPGVGPLAGFRGANGDGGGRGEPNPDQIDRYIENGGFWSEEIPEDAQFFKFANQNYQDFAVEKGFFDKPSPVTFQLYLEPLQKFRLAAEGHGDSQPPEHRRQAVADAFSPLPIWYPPFEGEAVAEGDFPLHALTQRPMAMYHSWGSQNAWLRQIHTANALYVPDAICDEMDLADGDLVDVVSHHARIRVPIQRMRAVNGSTVWTWNAIGKRKGAWRLDPDAPEAEKGFLLNHLIRELLPDDGSGQRVANSDPITGQAAWFDLRIRLEKVDDQENARTEPRFDAQDAAPGSKETPDMQAHHPTRPVRT